MKAVCMKEATVFPTAFHKSFAGWISGVETGFNAGGFVMRIICLCWFWKVCAIEALRIHCGARR